MAIILYGFAVCDAYFTAIEINRGHAPWISESPRTAAVLNLLTNGFGYFYLGERTKGMIVMIVGGVVGRVALRDGSGATALGLECGVALLAWDAWRIGNNRRAQSLAAAGDSVRPIGEVPTVSPILPLAVAILVGAGYLALLSWGSSNQHLLTIDQSKASITEHEGLRIYDNPTYQVKLVIPELWDFSPLDNDTLVSFEHSEASCSG
jgi:hypothetical protein